MGFEEIATKADLEKMKNELMAAIRAMTVTHKPKLLDLKGAAEYLGNMAIATLRHKASTFEIASHKNGKNLAFSTDDLDDYLARTRRRSEAELTGTR